MVKAVDAGMRIVLADIEALLATDIFSTEEAGGPLFKAAYVWLVLNVHLLLSELASTPDRVAFPGNVDLDVTDLIQKARYAIVHAGGSARRKRTTTNDDYAVLVGAPSGFADDIAVRFGGIEILVRRHVVSAYEAARALIERA